MSTALTTTEALNILYNAASAAHLTRKDHELVSQSIETLRNVLVETEKLRRYVAELEEENIAASVSGSSAT